MKNPEEEINRVWDLAVYLQMMAAFCKELDFNLYIQKMNDFSDLIKNQEDQVLHKLPTIENELWSIARPLLNQYPLKKDYQQIAKNWNYQFKLNKEVLSYGITIGWLEEQIDLSNFYSYNYYPYHFKIGLGIHKGLGEIEENFLLSDAFSCLLKAKFSLQRLEAYGEKKKKEFKAKNIPFDAEIISTLNNLKYEVALYSRLSLITFFSFLECFVNSIGYDYYCRNKSTLTKSQSDILHGIKKGGYLSLKSKIENYQKLIRPDNAVRIIITDPKQIKDPYKTLFEKYEQLRNSAMHFAPNKISIWLKPHDWYAKADLFSKLSIEAALNFWKICHGTKKGPDYLGRLEYKRLYDIAESKQNSLRS